MKACSARRVVRSPEPATVGLNNRSADTEPHTGAVFLGCKEALNIWPARLGGSPIPVSSTDTRSCSLLSFWVPGVS
jgi:hypothetical protein